MYVKIVREKAAPEYIARGWAIGMFYGCLVPFGLQLVLSLPTAFLMRGSKIGATLGTLITNHITIFFIYPMQCYVGSLLINTNHSFKDINLALKDVLQEQSFEALGDIGIELLASFFLGGALLTAVMTPLTYWFVKRAVIIHRKRAEARKMRKMARLMAQEAAKFINKERI